MAEIKEGVLGGFSGTVGPVVGARWRNKDIIRSRPRKTTKEPTESQLLQRAKFKLVTQFLQPVQGIVSRYFGYEEGNRSRSNNAMAYTITDAVELSGGVPALVYNKVMFTKGSLTGIQNCEAEPLPDHVLRFTWEDNSEQANANADDIFCFVLYWAHDESFFMFETEADRSRESVEITLPAYLSGESVETWAYFHNVAKNKACNSLYLRAQDIT